MAWRSASFTGSPMGITVAISSPPSRWRPRRCEQLYARRGSHACSHRRKRHQLPKLRALGVVEPRHLHVSDQLAIQARNRRAERRTNRCEVAWLGRKHRPEEERVLLRVAADTHEVLRRRVPVVGRKWKHCAADDPSKLTAPRKQQVTFRHEDVGVRRFEIEYSPTGSSRNTSDDERNGTPNAGSSTFKRGPRFGSNTDSTLSSRRAAARRASTSRAPTTRGVWWNASSRRRSAEDAACVMFIGGMLVHPSKHERVR